MALHPLDTGAEHDERLEFNGHDERLEFNDGHDARLEFNGHEHLEFNGHEHLVVGHGRGPRAGPGAVEAVR